jgi:hypothetical protein
MFGGSQCPRADLDQCAHHVADLVIQETRALDFDADFLEPPADVDARTVRTVVSRLCRKWRRRRVVLTTK